MLYQPNRIKLSGDCFYVLCLNSSNSIAEAEKQSKEIAEAGGSGYILSGKSFKATAAAYKNKDDAQKVLARLRGDYPLAHIKTVNIKKSKIKKTGDKNADKKLKKIMRQPLDLINFLLNKSTKLDTLQILESEILFELNSYQKTFADNKKTLEQMLLNSPLDKTLSKALGFYADVIENWGYISALTASFGNFNHRIKYFSCFVIDLYSAMRLNVI